MPTNLRTIQANNNAKSITTTSTFNGNVHHDAEKPITKPTPMPTPTAPNDDGNNTIYCEQIKTTTQPSSPDQNSHNFQFDYFELLQSLPTQQIIGLLGIEMRHQQQCFSLQSRSPSLLPSQFGNSSRSPSLRDVSLAILHDHCMASHQLGTSRHFRQPALDFPLLLCLHHKV